MGPGPQAAAGAGQAVQASEPDSRQRLHETTVRKVQRLLSGIGCAICTGTVIILPALSLGYSEPFMRCIICRSSTPMEAGRGDSGEGR